jgi:predicted RNA-binding Zn ribbon-like protein
MASSPPSRSLTADLPFKFVGGDPSLDLVNTVDWTPSGLEHDRLGSYDRLVPWARGAGVLSDAQAHALRHAAGRDLDKAQAAYESARWTRWVLHEVFYAVITRQPLSESLPEFSRLLTRANQHLDLAPAPAGRRPGGAALTWGWRGMPEQLECVLWPVVRAAANLLTSPDAGRLRMCAGPDCGWLYVDRSRNGLRRWCEMQTCGTLAKSRRRAERRQVQRRRPRGVRKD